MSSDLLIRSDVEEPLGKPRPQRQLVSVDPEMIARMSAAIDEMHARMDAEAKMPDKKADQDDKPLKQEPQPPQWARDVLDAFKGFKDACDDIHKRLDQLEAPSKAGSMPDAPMPMATADTDAEQEDKDAKALDDEPEPSDGDPPNNPTNPGWKAANAEETRARAPWGAADGGRSALLDDREMLRRHRLLQWQAKMQAAADSLGLTIEKPMHGELLLSYIKRTLRPFARFDSVWSKVDLGPLNAETMRVAADSIMSAMREEGIRPRDIPIGTLKSVTKRLDGGHTAIESHGSSGVWMAQAGSTGHMRNYVTGFARTNLNRDFQR
jgi:hypothetical protein